MDERKKLFLKKDPYAPPKDGTLFLRSARQLAAHHLAHCPGYARIAKAAGFTVYEKPEASVPKILKEITLALERLDS